MRQLQEELANTLKKLSMSEASLEVTSRCRMNLEDEVKDLKEKLTQSRSQVCMECHMSSSSVGG